MNQLFTADDALAQLQRDAALGPPYCVNLPAIERLRARVQQRPLTSHVSAQRVLRALVTAKQLAGADTADVLRLALERQVAALDTISAAAAAWSPAMRNEVAHVLNLFGLAPTPWVPQGVDLDVLAEVLDSWQEDNVSPDHGHEPGPDSALDFLTLLGQMGYSIVATDRLPTSCK